MKSSILMGVTCAVFLCWILSFQFVPLLPFSALFEPVYAQNSGEPFWVFDGHMHPMSSTYHRGGTIGEANADPRFTLPLGEQGGLGAAFVNTGIDEFYEANHLAVKDALKQFDHFYRELARYPDRIGVATNGDEVRALRDRSDQMVIFQRQRFFWPGVHLKKKEGLRHEIIHPDGSDLCCILVLDPFISICASFTFLGFVRACLCSEFG